MKNIEIEKVVKKYMNLATLSNSYSLHKDILYRHPLTDMLLGFCFEKSGFHIDGVYVNVFAQPLYLKFEHIILSFGDRLEGRNGDFWQLKNNPNLEKDMSELVKLMENSLSDFLDKVDSPAKFYDYYHDKCENLRMIEGAVYSAVYSNNADSELLLDNFIKLLKEDDLSIDWINSLLIQTEYLRSIVSDRAKVNTFFEDNILYTKTHLKLD